MFNLFRNLVLTVLLAFSGLTIAVNPGGGEEKVLKKFQKIRIHNHDDSSFNGREAIIIKVHEESNPVTYTVVTTSDKKKRVTKIPRSYFKLYRRTKAQGGALPKRPKKKKRAKLTFGEDTKTHDGTDRYTRFYAEYIKDIFNLPGSRKNRVVGQLMSNLDPGGFYFLIDKLTGLVARLRALPADNQKGVPILERGSREFGYYAMKKHLPHLEWHLENLKLNVKKLIEYIGKLNAGAQPAAGRAATKGGLERYLTEFKGKSRKFVIYDSGHYRRVFYQSTGTSNLINYPETFFPCFCKKSISMQQLQTHEGRISKCVFETEELNASFIYQMLKKASKDKRLFKANGIELGLIQDIRFVDSSVEKFPYGLQITYKKKDQTTGALNIDLVNKRITQEPEPATRRPPPGRLSFLTPLRLPDNEFTALIQIYDDRKNQKFFIQGDPYNILGLLPFLMKFNSLKDLKLSFKLSEQYGTGFWKSPMIARFAQYLQSGMTSQRHER